VRRSSCSREGRGDEKKNEGREVIARMLPCMLDEKLCAPAADGEFDNDARWVVCHEAACSSDPLS